MLNLRKRKRAFMPWQQTPGESDITGTSPDADYDEADPRKHWWDSYYLKHDIRQREEGDGVKFPSEIPFMEHQKKPFNIDASVREGQMNTTDVFPFPQDEYNENWYDLTHGDPPLVPQDVQDITNISPHPRPKNKQRKLPQELEEERAYEPESFRPLPLSLRKNIDLEPTDTITDRDIAWASRRQAQMDAELEPGVDQIRNDDTGQMVTVVDTGADWHLVRDDETGEEFFLSQEDLEDPTTLIRPVFREL